MTDTIKSPLNDDRFEIIKTGNSTWPQLLVPAAGAGNFASGESITTIAHGLGFTPVVVAFVQILESLTLITDNYVVPSFSYFGLGTQAFWITFQIAADATNIYLTTDMILYGTTGSTTTGGSGFNCQYYLLKERIKRTS